MDCPKCGFPNADGAECSRCGVIFSKFRPPPADELAEPPPPPPLPAPPAVPAAALIQPAKKLDFGLVLGETFQTYFANFGTFTALSLLVSLPSFAFALLQPVGGSPQRQLAWTWGGIVLGMVFQAIATAALTQGVLSHLRGRQVSVEQCLQGAAGAGLTVLGVSVLQAIIVMLGTLACIVPGIIAFVALGVAIPAAVETRSGVIAALNRSMDLTQGNRWTVFVLFAILVLLTLVLFIGLAVGAGIVLAVSGVEPSETAVEIGLRLLTELLGVVPTGLSATACAVLYYRLRCAKESVDVQELASVFD
jgi:hypothetical protein